MGTALAVVGKMLFCLLDGGNDARQRNYGRRGGNCIGCGALESDFVRVWGGNEVRQCDYGRRGGNCIGHGGLERNLFVRVGGTMRVNETTDAAVGTALAVVG